MGIWDLTPAHAKPPRKKRYKPPHPNMGGMDTAEPCAPTLAIDCARPKAHTEVLGLPRCRQDYNPKGWVQPKARTGSIQEDNRGELMVQNEPRGNKVTATTRCWAAGGKAGVAAGCPLRHRAVTSVWLPGGQHNGETSGRAELEAPTPPRQRAPEPCP